MMTERKHIEFEPGYHEYGTFTPPSYNAFFDGDFIGSRPTKAAAESLLDAYVYAGLQHGTIPTDLQLTQERAQFDADLTAAAQQADAGLAYLRGLPQAIAAWEAEFR